MKHEPHANNNNKVQSGHETRDLINSETQNEQKQTPVTHKHQHEIHTKSNSNYTQKQNTQNPTRTTWTTPLKQPHNRDSYPFSRVQ